MKLWIDLKSMLPLGKGKSMLTAQVSKSLQARSCTIISGGIEILEHEAYKIKYPHNYDKLGAMQLN